MMTLYNDFLETEIGLLEVTASSQAIQSILFVESMDEASANRVTSMALGQLAEYFNHERTQFDLPIEVRGTEFQMSVWKQLQTIEYGKLSSYKDVAQAIANPKSVRAVGAANGRNPISIVVPCHRVIAADGRLSGYAGGVERKSWLLRHESRLGG